MIICCRLKRLMLSGLLGLINLPVRHLLSEGQVPTLQPFPCRSWEKGHELRSSRTDGRPVPGSHSLTPGV